MAVVAALLLALPIARASSAELAASDPAAPASGYRFGVFPYVPALTIDRIFGPVATRFARDLGQPVYLKTKSNFDRFHAELERESYDIIFVHPFFYVEAADQHDYVPLARLEGELVAVALVEQKRKLDGWTDLAGRTVALPPTRAAVAEMAKVALMKAGLVPGVDVIMRHYRTKVSCLQAVTLEAADTCVLPEFVLPQIEPIGNAPLRVLARTPPIKHLVFAAHLRVPFEVRETLQRSILSWADSPDAQGIMTAGAWSRFVPAADADYDQVRTYGTQLGVIAQR